MNMKRFIYTVLVSVLALGCSSKPENIVLTFNVTEPTSREVIIVCQNKITSVQIGRAHV